MTETCFRDWTELSPSERRHEAAASWARLRVHGRRLNAAVEVLRPDAPPEAEGPLADLPYATKDMFDRAGRSAGWGGVRPDGPVPHTTAAVLTRLDEAGAVEVAIAAMTELAYEPTGYNSMRGRTLNPWHPDVVCGGSSSGSAALVAVGAVVLGLGSDTGGSVRIPAGCCGITGLKPTGDDQDATGVMPLAPSLDTIGFMARSAAELELVLPIVSGRPAGPAAPFTRAAILGDLLDEADVAVRQALMSAVEALRESGVAMVAMRADRAFAAADRHALTVMQAESSRIHDGIRLRGPGSATLSRRLAKGRQVGDDDLAAALADRTRLTRAFLEGLGSAEMALLPVMPTETPLAAEVDPTDPAFEPRVLYRMSRFTRFVNYLRLPALSLPCGFDGRGVPIGLQMIGPPGGEARLLATAARIQAATDWHGRRPPAAAEILSEDATP